MLAVLLPLHPDRLAISPADVTNKRLQLFELFTQNIGTTIRAEWLPQAVVPRPFTSDVLVEPDVPLPAVPLEGADLQATLLERRPTRQTWRVQGSGGRLALPLLYWPGWTATVDGARVAAEPLQGSGHLTLAVPPGEHRFSLASAPDAGAGGR